MQAAGLYGWQRLPVTTLDLTYLYGSLYRHLWFPEDKLTLYLLSISVLAAH